MHASTRPLPSTITAFAAVAVAAVEALRVAIAQRQQHLESKPSPVARPYGTPATRNDTQDAELEALTQVLSKLQRALDAMPAPVHAATVRATDTTEQLLCKPAVPTALLEPAPVRSNGVSSVPHVPRVPLPPHAEAWEGDEDEDDDDDDPPVTPPPYMQARVISPRTSTPVAMSTGLAILTPMLADAHVDHVDHAALVQTALRTKRSVDAAAEQQEFVQQENVQQEGLTDHATWSDQAPLARHLSRMARKLWEYERARPGIVLAA